ncbi:PepSY domain-containing protein [Nonomuraea sp. NPDC050328]|uniref:PepSY domain-containing protein n=1 Tax=Nonomuraea sp. NPDC050328 TaxID=3364361 RepID=UPI003789A0A2
MQKTTKIIVVSVAAMAVVAGGSAAFAASQEAPAITKERAVQIAQAQVPGATLTDAEHDGKVWEVELRKDTVEHDFDIDDQNGKVLKHDTETDAQDDADDAQDDD